MSNIGPVPHMSQSVRTLGNVLWMASTILLVGLVRPVKMELSVAFEMPMLPANDCWFMCWASMSCLILSFIEHVFCSVSISVVSHRRED